MDLDSTTVFTYTDICTISSCFTVQDVPGSFLPVPGMENTFQGMLYKNVEKYPGQWVYSWSAPSFLSKGL